MLEDQKINKARRKWQKQTEFLCTIKFRNSLPDPPLGPHFLELPLDLEKYVKYKPTTLESDYKWKVTRSVSVVLLLSLLYRVVYVGRVAGVDLAGCVAAMFLASLGIHSFLSRFPFDPP